MHNIFIIKELLEHILSFIPKKLIIPWALTCKTFYNATKIDFDQESVAKNSDMFSLHKIPYSIKAVMNIAADYNNVDMIKYLLNKNTNLFDDYDTIKIIGRTGDENLLSKVPTKYLSTATFGICEGLHFDLFEKYKSHLHKLDNFELVTMVYKLNNKDMIRQAINYVAKFQPGYNEGLIYGKLVGKCARKNEIEVLLYIQKLLSKNKFRQYDCITYVCGALIEGEHYDILLWFLNEEVIRTQYKYECSDNDSMERLIKNNNLKLFKFIIANHCVIWIHKGHNVVHEVTEITGEDYLDFCGFVELCIDYRRVEILTFLITYIRFNFIRYQEFLDKAQSLKFDDITNVLISNKHLFMEYDE